MIFNIYKPPEEFQVPNYILDKWLWNRMYEEMLYDPVWISMWED